MPIVNAVIAAVFEEIADLLDLQGANAFRIGAPAITELLKIPGLLDTTMERSRHRAGKMAPAATAHAVRPAATVAP